MEQGKTMNAWYVPNIKKILFSVLVLQDKHLQSEFVSKTENINTR